jgi:hypothetical protein
MGLAVACGLKRTVSGKRSACLHAWIGDRIEPMTELLIQVVEIAEHAAKKKVLADVSEGPLDLALRFGPIGPASPRLKAAVAGEVDEGAVVDDERFGVLADDRGLHAIVEDRARRAADRLEGGDMATQNASQILVEDEPRPDQAGVAEHHRKEPDDALDRLLVEELDLEPGEVDLRLLARRRLEAQFVSGAAGGSNIAHAVAHDAVAAGIAALLDLTEQTPRGQGGIGRQALAQIRFEAIDNAGRRRALLVGRRLQPFGNVCPDGLSVAPDLPGDGADGQALAMQIQDHDELPKFDHRVLPPARRRNLGDSVRPSVTKTGEISNVTSGENCSATQRKFRLLHRSLPIITAHPGTGVPRRRNSELAAIDGENLARQAAASSG